MKMAASLKLVKAYRRIMASSAGEDRRQLGMAMLQQATLARQPQ